MIDALHNAEKFLKVCPTPWKTSYGKVISKLDRSVLLKVYLKDVEPHYRDHFNGGLPSDFEEPDMAFEDKMGDYPKDWEWRSYAVKADADFRYVVCVEEGNDRTYPVGELNAHHHSVSARTWREVDLADVIWGTDFPDGPHSFENLESRCIPHHKDAHEVND